MISRFRVNALLCAFLLMVCVLAAQPYAETGISDDWSYIRTAQILSQTGHVVYNGWATAMVGWQLFPAALFFRVFGFSFTVARITVLIVAMATAFLLQRSLVRAGIQEWNATLATLALVLSPLFLPISFIFFTDISGIFAIVLCLYCCLRALQAATTPSAALWISSAALTNAIGGTARQIAWLGLLVMVPSTLWLLRARGRVVVVSGIACTAAGVAILYGSLHWFNHQAYSVPEHLFRSRINRGVLASLPENILRPALELPLLLLPVLLMFLPSLLRGGRRTKAAVVACALLCVVLAAYLQHAKLLQNWLPPTVIVNGSILSIHGLIITWPVHGDQPVVLQNWFRLLLAAATLLGLLALVASFFSRSRLQARSADASHHPLPWFPLLIVVLPFTIAYVALLVPRGLFGLTLDRYLVPLVIMLLLILVRYYQEGVRQKLPVASLLLIALFAAYGIAATHDMFALYRSTLIAANELRASGVPASSIDGGWEYNSWTQILRDGFIDDAGVQLPRGVPFVANENVNVCPVFCGYFYPAVHARYSFSFHAEDCAGRTRFSPVTYRRWLGFNTATIYIVSNPIVPGKSWSF